MQEPFPYTITEILEERGRATLYRAVRRADHARVILEVLDPRRCLPKDVARQRSEYEIGRTLELPAVVRPLALETYQGMPALVVEDSGGQPLDHLLGEPMPVERFLPLAIRIAGAVADVHREGIVHKDLTPATILVNPATGEVKLNGFGLASRLPHEAEPARPPRLIEGSLPYMSPEQTGRMNIAIDERADLYSLGVTFYQLVTGRLPFTAADPLEWVHCHVARPPTSPAQHVPQLPEAISQIVLKLLAKRVDDRYQTARGLRHDLERCLAQWSDRGEIAPFPLGERDAPSRLRIPQQLYGREEETGLLLQAFERVAATGSAELLLVKGYAGVGKSTLVRELQKPLAGHGLFLAGKFDQLSRGVPYAPIARAMADLVLGLLAEDEPRLRQWRQRVQKALGINGQLIAGLVPPLKLLIGDQPPVQELPVTEAEPRFRQVFRDFLGAITREDQPLVLFLDDLQWADVESLRLIEDVIGSPDTHHLLLIGAYRDNEVGASHPLERALERIRRTPAAVSELVLPPLRLDHLVELVAETVHAGAARARPLAALAHEKTGGNPFFVIQFLTMLHEEHLLEFDEAVLAWRWDTAKIQEKGYTDNVAELMVRRLACLPAATRDALRIAACIGNREKIAILALSRGKSEEEARADLWPAIRAGLILRSDDWYAFAHDRIQQAAYSLIPEGQRASVHLEIGRLLLSRARPDELEERLFEIVNQLHRGAARIVSREERERVAELSLTAARRAKAATAWALALRYTAEGRALLGEDCWDRRYELAFALELHRADCEYLTGQLTAAEERLAALARRARGLVDAAAVACSQMALFATMGRADRSVEACLEYLRRLDIRWSPRPADGDVHREYDRIWQQLGSRPIEELIDLPAMTDPVWRATMDVLMWGQAPALFTDRNLWALLIGRMANLSLEHGNSDGSCLGYVWLGGILGPQCDNYRAGFRFGKLGFDLLEKRGLLRFKAQAYVGFGSRVSPWTRHLRSGIDLLRAAFDAALETGNFSYACYACPCLITLLLAAGDPLGDVQREAERLLGFVEKVGFRLVAITLTGQLRLIRTLRGEGDFDEELFESCLEGDQRLAIGACWYWIRKLQARFHAGDYAAALDTAAKAGRLFWTSLSFFEAVEYHFYAALAHAAFADTAPAGEQREHQQALAEHHRRLQTWSENCPVNFEDRASLAGAEIARLGGRSDEAMELYERAIRAARRSGFVQNEALAHELAARFYRARGLNLVADAYLREAAACYARWGATGKERQLAQQHPDLLEPRAAAPAVSFAARAEQLDLLSVAKAAQTISSEMVLDRLLRTLLQVVLEQSGAQRGLLLLDREGKLSIEAEATFDEKGVHASLLQSEPVGTSSRLVPASIVQYVQRTKEHVILEDGAQAGRFSSDPYITLHQPRSVLCLPIQRQAVVVGVLYLENDLLSGAFTPERLLALELLAAQAAISVENAALLNRAQAARTLAEEARGRAAFLAEAGAMLSESLDDQRTLDRLTRLCVRSLAGWCAIDLFEGGELRCISAAHADAAKEPLLRELQQRYPARRGSGHPAAQVVRTREPLLLVGVTQADLDRRAQDGEHARLLRELGTESVVAVPLVARRQMLGAISLAVAHGRRYGPVDVELAQELARLAAMAIDNTRLYRKSQEAIRLRDEFLSVASHELYTPITALMLTSERMLREAGRDSKPDPKTALDQLSLLARQGRRLVRLVRELLDVSRIEMHQLPLELSEMELGSLVQEVVERMEPDLAQSGCSVSIRAGAPVRGRWDRSRLDQVITNLLANAAKFGPGRPIEITAVAEGGFARLVIKDYGIGISPAEQGRIFERFARAAPVSQYGGLGLGLYISKRIVDAHGGSIRVESQPGSGSSFTVELPCERPAERAGALQ
jgi:predicted ATPase/signal transduction histidine kinase